MENEFITREEFARFKKAVISQFKKVDHRIEETWDEIHEIDEAETKVADEAVEKAERAYRLAARVKKQVDAL